MNTIKVNLAFNNIKIVAESSFFKKYIVVLFDPLSQSSLLHLPAYIW
jgi:hypothetical protein